MCVILAVEFVNFCEVISWAEILTINHPIRCVSIFLTLIQIFEPRLLLISKWLVNFMWYLSKWKEFPLTIATSHEFRDQVAKFNKMAMDVQIRWEVIFHKIPAKGIWVSNSWFYLIKKFMVLIITYGTEKTFKTLLEESSLFVENFYQ